MSLDDAIRSMIELGEGDPLTIKQKLVKRYGGGWLREQVGDIAEEVVMERARQLVGVDRRNRELALRPGGKVASGEMKLARMCIPTKDGLYEWKRVADVTAEDLEARAEMYDKIAGTARSRSRWLREVAGLMRAENVLKLGDLKADLPPLPSGASLNELVAA